MKHILVQMKHVLFPKIVHVACRLLESVTSCDHVCSWWSSNAGGYL